MTAKTPAQRKAAERQRLKDQGKVPLTVWARKENHEAIKTYARMLDAMDTKAVATHKQIP